MELKMQAATNRLAVAIRRLKATLEAERQARALEQARAIEQAKGN